MILAEITLVVVLLLALRYSVRRQVQAQHQHLHERQRLTRIVPMNGVAPGQQYKPAPRLEARGE